MEVIHNNPNCECSLYVRNPCLICQGLLHCSLAYSSLGDCSMKSRGKVRNALTMNPPIIPKQSACSIPNLSVHCYRKEGPNLRRNLN
uniref:Uncharacterized protein n=1 Tax=Arundo donax TaxID=35708 RepID=A0A0A9A9B4_ARUDO